MSLQTHRGDQYDVADYSLVSTGINPECSVITPQTELAVGIKWFQHERVSSYTYTFNRRSEDRLCAYTSAFFSC